MPVALHAPTIMTVLFVVAATMGIFFLYGWARDRKRVMFGWLGIGNVMAALGCLGLATRGATPDWMSIGLANACNTTAYGLIWAGIRGFEARPRPPAVIVAGAAIWGAACLVPSFYGSLAARTVLISLLAAGYCIAASVDLARGATRDPLPSRVTGVWIMRLHAAVCLLRVPSVFLSVPDDLFRSAVATPVIIAVMLEAVAFLVATALVLLLLETERAHRRQERVASTDPLTGIDNRRAFMAVAEARIEGLGRPGALIMLDLDHFKSLNDSFGHAAGDRALVAFCRLVEARLEPGMAFGRLGGEEFACLLPTDDAGAAVAFAETLRTALTEAEIVDAGQRLSLTVTAGIATTRMTGRSVVQMVAAADIALYAAKRAGRDRVAVFDPASPSMSGDMCAA